jgi:hypothetical protein
MPYTPPPLEEALRLAEMDLVAFPLDPNSKEPAIEGWSGRRRPYPEGVLRKWFAKWPEANLGLRTGSGSLRDWCLVVLDFDPRNGGDRTLAKYRERYKLPDQTPTAITPSGGVHLVYGSRRPIGSFNGFAPGLDIRGDGGMIVVEPSVIRGKEYVWTRPLDLDGAGVLALPDELAITLSAATQRRMTKAAGSTSTLTLTQAGDVGRLVAEMVERFPIRGPGQRHKGMAPVIASLLGRGYDVATTRAVVMIWTDHFHRARVCRTSAAAATNEIDDAIAYTIKSGRIKRAVGTTDHAAALATIELDARQQYLLKTSVSELVGRAPSAGGRLCMGGTVITRRLSDKLCRSADEEAFVEALIFQATYDHSLGRPLAFTDKQITAIAAARRGVRWEKEQVRRLKAKYITTDKRPASVLPLLIRLKEGKLRLADGSSYPSQYEPAYLVAFLGQEGLVCGGPQDLAA